MSGGMAGSHRRGLQRVLAFLAVAVAFARSLPRSNEECDVQDAEDIDETALFHQRQLHNLLHENRVAGTQKGSLPPASELQRQLQPALTQDVSVGTDDGIAALLHPWWNRLIKPKRTAAQASGVGSNSDDDMKAFKAGLTTNVMMSACLTALFIVCLRLFPVIFQNRVLDKTAPMTPPEGLFGWARASLAVSNEEVEQSVGLDNAMLLEFTNFSMRLLFKLGVPLVFFLAPMHYFAGGHAAGKDSLSYFSIGNVAHGNWMYWLHAGFVWFVIITVQRSIYEAQGKFLVRRFQWLRSMPQPRATTVLVECVPPEYQSDEELRRFFVKMFSEDKIKSAYMVKHTENLCQAIDVRDSALLNLKEAKTLWDREGKDPGKRPQFLSGTDKIGYWTQVYNDAKAKIVDERKQVEDSSKEIGKVNTSTGFVTFTAKREAEIALRLDYKADDEEWVVSIPPGPDSIRWEDLKAPPHKANAQEGFGYLLVFLLYVTYLPLVIGISRVAESVNMGKLNPLWTAFAPTLGLLFMVSFLPTFLINIFKEFFCLKDEAWAQYKVHSYYFWFNLVFVVLVTAVGRSVLNFTFDVVSQPTKMFSLFAATMPYATHFYMNFIVLQWSTHFMNLLRYVNLGKFILAKRFYEEEDARKLSEPENQDYYGLGSRNARFTTNLIIGIIFSTLSPPVAVLTFINFAICRLVYGYMIPFAEMRKPDLGGAFWMQNMHHLFIGLIIYCVLMTGVISSRADSHWPGTVTGPSLIYVITAWRRFRTEFKWERLPFTELVGDKDIVPPESGLQYVQPGLKDTEEEPELG